MTTFHPSDEQRAVIAAPLRSLRISAGAGTGKTTTLAHRVAALVAEHGIDPEQILGITFTTKAAEELTERIRAVTVELVGPGREVEVHTYHGFAHGLLAEFGALVGVERRTQIVTPAFARQLIDRLVRTVPLAEHDATRPNTVEDVRGLSDALADHLLGPHDVVPDEGDDDPWPSRRDLLRLARAYSDEKRRLGVADYGDLVRLAHRLVREHPATADAVRRRYRAVVLDEYQDTNPAQRELLRELFAGRVPVMAVGDPDQTIYEWRGASLENFRDFPSHFADGAEPAPTLPLSLNRRSGPLVLDVANRVRSRIEGSEGSPLRPLPDASADTVTAAWYPTATAEADAVAASIVEIHEQGRSWGDVAVLFRKNKDMLLVHEALGRHGIPFEVANLGGLLSVPEVTDLHAWLRILHAPEDGPALARILLGSRYRLGLADLAPPARWVRERRRISELDHDHEMLPGVSLLEAIDHLDELDGLRPPARDALEAFTDEYRALLEVAQGANLVELCRTILDRTGAWSDLEAMDPNAGLSARLNLYRFLDLAESWSPLEGRPSLGAFLGHLEAMQEDPAEELDTARLSDADAVTLITVHRAKGLEWPVVYLPAVYRRNFPSQSHRYDDPYGSARSVPYEWRLDRAALPAIDADMPDRKRKDALRAHHEAQEWRIAYVAVTRAKEELHVSGAHWYGHPEPTVKPVPPSDLFELVSSVPGVRLLRPVDDPPERPTSLGSHDERVEAPDPLATDGWPEILRSAISDPAAPAATAAGLGLTDPYDAAVAEYQQMLFDLPEPVHHEAAPPIETSATGLVTYAACPKRYYWSEVDRLPRRPSAAARRGVDVHRRIELHHLGVVPLDEGDPDSDSLVEGAAPATSRQDPFSAFLGSRFADRRPRMVEAPFALRLQDRVWVRGRIDAVYERDGSWEVVDFKSGRPRSDPWLLVQLQTYAVALVDVPLAPAPPDELAVTFAYLGGGAVEHRHDVDATWLDEARDRLARLADDIEAERWEPSPSEACRSCDFARFCPEGGDWLRRHE